MSRKLLKDMNLLQGRRAAWEVELLRKSCMEVECCYDLVTEPRKGVSNVRARCKVARHLRSQGFSLPEIARLLGYRSHTSVMDLLKPDRHQSGKPLMFQARA